MTDGFKGYRKEPFLMLLHRHSRSSIFLTWTRTGSFSLWLYLQSYIVRTEGAASGKINLHEEFWKKGFLAARWKVEILMEKLGVSKSTILRWLADLEELGVIRIEKVRRDGSYHNVYIFGTHDFHNNDLLYMDVVFTKLEAEENLNRYKKD